METFTFSPRIGVTPQTSHRTTSTQFGDGYMQVVADGINTKMTVCQLDFVGTLARIREIADFLDRHAGVFPFNWKPYAELDVRQWIASDGYTGPTKVGANSYGLQVVFKTFNQLPKP